MPFNHSPAWTADRGDLRMARRHLKALQNVGAH